jgi:hypothetical protein
MATLPPETRQSYQRFNLRQQYALIWIACIVWGLAFVLRWVLLMPVPILYGFVALYRQYRLERSLGLK